MTTSITTQGLNPSTPSVTLTDLLKVLSADVAGQNSLSAQPWFPSAGGVTVEADTTYEFEGQIHISRAAGTTSHTTSVLFGGTATLVSMAGLAQAKTGDTVASAAVNATILTDATAAVVKAASTSATEQISIRVRGIVRFDTAGTFIPQFQYSAAPGGAPTIKRDSFFKLRKLGSDTVTEIGTWS